MAAPICPSRHLPLKETHAATARLIRLRWPASRPAICPAALAMVKIDFLYR